MKAPGIKRWRVRAEYGPASNDVILWDGVWAQDAEAARQYAIRRLKKRDVWNRIDERNVYAEEMREEE